MSTTTKLMTPPNNESIITPTTTLFADVVFDRPLDHPYTYAVPSSLNEQIAVGKRVEVPFGRGDTTTNGYCVRVHENKPERTIKAITNVLDDQALLNDTLLRLTRWMADYYLCAWGQVLHAVLPAGVREQSGTREAVFIEAIADAELPQPIPVLTTKQSQTLKFLRDAKQPVEQRVLAKQAKVGTAVVKSLIEKGYARKFSERIEKSIIEHDIDLIDQRNLILNPEQQHVWEAIQERINTGGYHPFLLYGVTGSGKTEVYLRAIEQVVAAGKEVLVLVPEISLTPQTISRFRGRCGHVAVMHSHLSDAERGAHWRGIASGNVHVVVGARSAVFAPTRKLGLIIIDEEHENSFKQESTPRYHARDVAVMRAKLENIPIILGSATPSLESWANAERGQYQRLDLPNRVENRRMPKVQLIDMRHEPRGQGTYSSISPTLERGMKDALSSGGQVILMLNRRGFSTHVHCPSCGFVANCMNCDLALTFHRSRQSLVCHYCGHEQEPMRQCPTCQTPSILYQGIGTEKLQSEIEQKFPNKVVQRMDSDTMNKPGAHQRVLDAFRGGLVHILLGTQMIAKGLDFPNVTLVGVINADAGLHIPDFRAGERTFQLLAQVAGRAGRGEQEGRVMIQTHTPDHPSILLAANHDYLKFAEAELAQRREHLYPPFQRLARLIIRSENEAAAREFADLLAGAFEIALHRPERQQPQSAGVRLLGPAEAPVYRLNGYFRHHFQLQSASAALLHEVLREVLSVIKTPTNVEFQVDIDPFNMM